MLSSSNNSNVFKEREEKKDEKSNLLRKLLKEQGYQQVYEAKRRNAAVKGFGMFWKLGGADKKINKTSLFDGEKTLQKKSCKSSKNHEYKKSFLEELNEKLNSNLAIK